MALARTRVQAAETDAGAREFASLPADFDGRWRSQLTGRVIELVREGPGAFSMPASQPCDLLVPDNR